MKQLFTCLSLLCLLSVARAQTGTVPTSSTQNVLTIAQADELLTLKETEFDFGKIPQGKPVVHIFEVTNKSNTSLKINNINASCGCTTPEWEKDKVIAPGGNTKITVGYNAAAEGPFTKFITVTYNDTQSKQITIKGEVWKTPGSSAPENKAINDLKN
ncbi:MAG: DUF1573 domain-containing protein [Ferruginibacter sp.]|nr:DUF1573 domain-containing protein [Chitinophagaceae bacterium]